MGNGASRHLRKMSDRYDLLACDIHQQAIDEALSFFQEAFWWGKQDTYIVRKIALPFRGERWQDHSGDRYNASLYVMANHGAASGPSTMLAVAAEVKRPRAAGVAR